MNAQELYEELKLAADWFGVGFHGMHLIEVEVSETGLTFLYAGNSLYLSMKASETIQGTKFKLP